MREIIRDHIPISDWRRRKVYFLVTSTQLLRTTINPAVFDTVLKQCTDALWSIYLHHSQAASDTPKPDLFKELSDNG